MPSRMSHKGPLNPRQREILALLGEGKTNIAIQMTLGINTTAVDTNVKAIYRKLGLPSTRAAIFQAGRAHGLREAAEINDTYLIPNPIDDTERQTNEGTRAVSRILRQRADGILP